tara:strand:+ start:477 stop:656 length:180 start_codon:yes stop_codon:yes gene_type:complete
MSQIKNKIQDFLDNGGRDLEYDEIVLPSLEDMDQVLKEKIPVWDYFGKSIKEYYGGVDE